MSARPSWDEWFLGFAKAAAARGDCTRSKVGAVIARGHELIKVGYNGAPPGLPGCLSAGACPRGRHYPISNEVEPWRGPVCACGQPQWPCTAAAEPGQGDYADCIAVHAEVNAIVRAGLDQCAGATIYVTRKPCDGCFRLILAVGIERVIWPGMPEHLRE